MANHPELEQLMNKELQLRENGSPAEGKVVHIQPHKGGHIILVDMGYYKQEDVRDYYNYHKRFRVTVTQHPLEESIPLTNFCLLYTSPSPRDGLLSRMPSSA